MFSSLFIVRKHEKTLVHVNKYTYILAPENQHPNAFQLPPHFIQSFIVQAIPFDLKRDRHGYYRNAPQLFRLILHTNQHINKQH